MRTPLVSILVPARDAQLHIERAVRSALAQTHERLEVLVVADDGYDYEALLGPLFGARERRLRYLASAGQRGPSAARNIGLQASRGQVVAPLDADDTFHPERLARVLPYLGDGAVTDNRQVVDEGRGVALGTVLAVGDGTRRLAAGAFLDILTPLGLVGRRAAFGDGWDETLHFAEDTLRNLQVVEASGGLTILERPLHAYHVRRDSACHAADGAERARHAYAHCLRQLDSGTSGLRTATVRMAWRRALGQRQRMNTIFAGGPWPDYQRYLLGTGRLSAALPSTPASPAASKEVCGAR